MAFWQEYEKIRPMLLPKVIIQYSYLLDPMFREYFLLNPENKNKTLVELKELFKNIENYKKEWKLYEERILTGLLKLLPIKFLHNVIDVYVVSWLFGKAGISKPLIIRGDFKKDRFVEILSHEIIHFFLTNNDPKIFQSKITEKMFPKEKDLKTRNHIIVHAIQKYILLDVLKDNDRYIKDKEKTSHPKCYKKSWDIVEEKGYMNIISDFKNKIEISLNKK